MIRLIPIRKALRRFLPLLLAIILFRFFTACSNMRWGTSVGMDVRFGPSGPRVVPTMSVDMYSGGRF